MTKPQTEQDVYRTFGATIAQAARSPGFASRLRVLDCTFQFVLSDPSAVVTARFRRDQPFQVDYGVTDVVPDTTIRMSAINAQRFLLGELNVFLAIDQGELNISGPATEFLAIVPQMIVSLTPVYRTILTDPTPKPLAPRV